MAMLPYRMVSLLLLLFLAGCTGGNIRFWNAKEVNPSALPPAASPMPAKSIPNSQARTAAPYSLLINRANRRMEVLNSQGEVVWQRAIGIGSGGLRVKQDMGDLVTPTGEMQVDLILYKDPKYNQIASPHQQRFAQQPEFRNFVSDRQGLENLFGNMNRLDFDGNGSPDRAYGVGYIGLTSETVITGPKMSWFVDTPYWFSIALHGTPNPANIGQANSGGCVHVDAESLQLLIERGWVKLGTTVKIVD